MGTGGRELVGRGGRSTRDGLGACWFHVLHLKYAHRRIHVASITCNL